MSVNSIATGSMATHQLQSVISAGAANKQVKVTSPSKDTASTQTLKSSVVDPNAGNKISSDKAPSPVVSNKNSSGSAGVVSHVVVSYNQQGKMRTKFEDSRNNVVYQMPSEAAAKLEDQITTSNKFTSIKG